MFQNSKPNRSERTVINTAEDGGAALAEFALVLPLLIMLLFGIIEFGIAFNRAQAVEAAAREGARLASLSSTTFPEVESRVNDALTGIPLDDPSDPAVDRLVNGAPDADGCVGNQGDPVTVTVSASHTIDIPLFPPWAINLQGQAVFRCEA